MASQNISLEKSVFDLLNSFKNRNSFVSKTAAIAHLLENYQGVKA